MKGVLDLSRIVFAPKKKLFGMVILAINKPEVNHMLADLLLKYNIKPLYTIIISKDDEIEITTFLDLSDAKTTSDKLVEEVLKIGDVKEVEVIKPLFKGLLIDTYHFPLTISGERACIFRKSILKGLFKDIKVELGEAGKVFLYYQGEEVGKSIYENYGKYAPLEEGMLTLFAELVKAVGWGIVEIVYSNLIEGIFTIRVYNSIECEFCETSNEPCGYFAKGVLAGLLSKITGKKIEVKETKCIAMGDPYCQFEAKPSEYKLP